MSTAADFARCLRYAEWYRDHGFNPLPSRAIGRRVFPPWRYGEARDRGLSGPSYARLADRFGCDAVQLALGPRWGLCVVDLDGPVSLEVWDAITLYRPVAPTWAVRHDDSGGMHLWFRCPAGWTPPHKTVLWEHGRERHSLIELLGDRNLIVAPPTVSPRSGNRYRFLPGRGPRDIDRPAELPGWLIEMASARTPAVHAPATARRCPAITPPHRPDPARRRGREYDRREVLGAIPDKVALAASWGLRVACPEPNAAGWCRCRSIFREDRDPSAMFHAELGIYWESGLRGIGLFDLAALLRAYPSWRDACNDLGDELHVEEGYRVAG